MDTQTKVAIEKALARQAIHRAVKKGLLQRPEICSRCGISCKPEGHHPDYNKPLQVEWLCFHCHKKEHHPGYDPTEGRGSKGVKVQLWLSPEVKARFEQAAARQGLSVAAWFRRAGNVSMAYDAAIELEEMASIYEAQEKALQAVGVLENREQKLEQLRQVLLADG